MIIDHTGVQTMLYLTCTTITSVDLAHHGVSRAKDWVSVNCGTILSEKHLFFRKGALNQILPLTLNYSNYAQHRKVVCFAA